MNQKKRLNKKGQLTIFIIIAMVIIASAIIFFSFSETGQRLISPIFGSARLDINQEIKNCFENNEKIDEKINTILEQGGEYSPKNFVLYKNIKIEYLCYTPDYLLTCYIQKPLLLKSIEEEIALQVKPEMQECINKVENSLKSKGYSVSSSGIKKVDIKIVPKKINIETDYSISARKGDDVQSYESVGFEITRKEIYDLIMIASSILQYETKYGETETVSFMVIYPDIKIEKTIKDDGTKIYMLTNRNTKEKFNFASRSLVFPPGLNTNTK
ncbi:MAG TPA: hypothetical protein P5277_02775 [Candidatus Paceibacterota bacterium]|nr:hypothetical protein [Candidatus Paceibacterota bacterium]